jgi:hypothetical protein
VAPASATPLSPCPPIRTVRDLESDSADEADKGVTRLCKRSPSQSGRTPMGSHGCSPRALGQDLLAIMREILGRNAVAERLTYSPDEAAELLGISGGARP